MNLLCSIIISLWGTLLDGVDVSLVLRYANMYIGTCEYTHPLTVFVSMQHHLLLGQYWAVCSSY